MKTAPQLIAASTNGPSSWGTWPRGRGGRARGFEFSAGGGGGRSSLARGCAGADPHPPRPPRERRRRRRAADWVAGGGWRVNGGEDGEEARVRDGVVDRSVHGC